MAVWQVENGTATGRGFADVDTNGYLAKFKEFVVKAPASDGPGWYIVLDKSTTPVIKTFDYTDINIATDEITITAHGFHTGDRLLYTGNAGGISATMRCIKIDADTIQVSNDLRYAVRDISSQGTGTQSFILDGAYIIVSPNATPTPNGTDPIMKVGMISSIPGTIYAQNYFGFNGTTKALSGLWYGTSVDTLDSAAFLYDFRMGEYAAILQSKVSGVWKAYVVAEWERDANLLVDDVSSPLTSAATAGTDQVLQLGAGEAASFTVNNNYYIYDMTDNNSWVDYLEVTSVNTGTDQLIVSGIRYDYPIGAVIGSYPHRLIGMGNNYGYGTDFTSNQYSLQLRLPYYSYYYHQNCFHDQYNSINGGADFVVADEYLDKLNPSDNGLYTAMRPGIVEVNNTSGYSSSIDQMNRGYGTLRNIYVGHVGTMSPGQDGRKINSIDYLYFETGTGLIGGSGGNHAVLFQHTESPS